MEVDTSMQIPTWEAIQLVERKTLAKELDCEDPIVFYDDSLALHQANYQRDTRNIFLKCVNIKANKVTNKWGLGIEIKNVNLSDVMQNHRATGEALADTVDDQGKDNARI